MSARKISVERFSSALAGEHVRLARTVYSAPEVLDPAHLQWKHQSGCGGSSHVVCLRTPEGGLVGRSFLQPRPFFSETGRPMRAAVITDVVIDPANRNAASLIALTKAATKASEFDLVVHTSNETSDALYRKLFKYPVVMTLVAAAFPLRGGRLAAALGVGKLGRIAVDALLAPWRWGVAAIVAVVGKAADLSFGPQPTEEIIGEILRDFRENAGPHFERDPAFMQWRFHSGPLFRAQVLWIWRRGECLGYLAFRHADVNGMRACIVLDAVLKRPLSRVEGVALKFLCIRHALEHECDLVFSLFNDQNPMQAWLRGVPFARIPDRLLPHPTPIFMHCHDPSGFQASSRRKTFLTLADLDYF